LLLASVVLVGCGQMSNPEYDLSSVRCEGAPASVISAIEAELRVDGTLRNGKQATGRGTTFVSVELHRADEDRHDSGDILTFASADPDLGEFLAVDVNARDDTTWPHAPVDVRAEGARESRGCVRPSLGKTKEQIACEQDQTDDNVQIGLTEDCSEL
jgi:hypothetical protein